MYVLDLLKNLFSSIFSLQQCFADERETSFETISWGTYLRYVTANKSLVYVLIFIVVVFAIEVKCDLKRFLSFYYHNSKVTFLIFFQQVAGSVIGIFLITE